MNKKGNTGTKGVHRLNVNFNEGAYTVLQELATEKNKNMAEVLRDSITLEKWLMDTIKDGGKILVENKGVIREVIFR